MRSNWCAEVEEGECLECRENSFREGGGRVMRLRQLHTQFLELKMLHLMIMMLPKVAVAVLLLLVV